jgi:hypothetical protein
LYGAVVTGPSLGGATLGVQNAGKGEERQKQAGSHWFLLFSNSEFETRALIMRGNRTTSEWSGDEVDLKLF